MRYHFDECLERGKIVKIRIDQGLVAKELREAEADLAAAERSLQEHQEKWAIIQGYYSLFHSLRSQVFGKGYREKSHRCLKYAVEALFVDQGLLDPVVLEHFHSAIDTVKVLITVASIMRSQPVSWSCQHDRCMRWSGLERDLP